MPVLRNIMLKVAIIVLMMTVLTYTFCLPKIAQAKEKKMQEVVRAVTDEMKLKGQEIVDVTLKNAN